MVGLLHVLALCFLKELSSAIVQLSVTRWFLWKEKQKLPAVNGENKVTFSTNGISIIDVYFF